MNITHWLAISAALGVTAPAALAQTHLQTQARVLSAVPVTQQVGVPQQVCSPQQVYEGQRTNGSGAVIGAVVGGLLGNQVARGSYAPRGPYGHPGRYHHGGHDGGNRTAGTIIGALAGGFIGNQIEGRNGGTPAYRTVNHCENEVVYESRIVGYDVTYEHGGRRYYTRMDHDPGRWMPVATTAPASSYSTQGQAHTPAASAVGRTVQTQPSPAQASTRFVGPSGVYTSAPPGVPSVQSMEYRGTPYTNAVPAVIVDVHPQGYYHPQPAQPHGY